MFYETVIEKATRQEYQVLASKTGENPQPCPVCSHDRKKKNTKCLSYNSQKETGSCQHCGAIFYKKNENYKSYKRPEWENKTALSDKVIEWFSLRNISQATLLSMQVSEGKEWMPQVSEERNVICFNYFREGKLVNVKYRDGQKNFKMFKDAEKIFYNLDGIKAAKEVYIVEGEMDCLTMVQAGFTNTVSVPNGATKGNNNLDYLDNCWNYFENVEKVYIATDSDEPGQNLALELARRIGIEKCYKVSFGEFKDVNEQLCKSGKVSVDMVTPFPIEGLFTVEDHWEAFLSLLKNGFPKGWQPRGRLGEMISFFPGYTTIITGIPGHGKSEVLDQMLLQISIDYNLRGAYFTPENWPTELHLIKIVEKLIGKSAFKANELELKKSKEFLQERMFWVYPEEGYKLEDILNKIRQAVLKYGIQWFVLDPWNKLEHQDDSTNYVSRCLDLISNFNKKNGTHAFIVAHPTKMRINPQTEKYDVPGLYDISGSANFYNKADIGLSMYKEEPGKNTLVIQKVKFKFWGAVGSLPLNWNSENGRYDEYGSDLTNWVAYRNEHKLIDFTLSKAPNDEVPF
jgi:twinkle protein